MNIQDIEIGVGDRTINATVFSPETPDSPGVICFPGYKSKRSLYYEHGLALAREVGATCLTVDISGHGETPGDLFELSRQDLYDDSVAAYDALAMQADVNPDRLGVVGTSFGGHLAVNLLRRRNPKSILLRAPSIKEDLPTLPNPDEMDLTTTHPISRLLGIGKPSKSIMSEKLEAAAQSDDLHTQLRAYLPKEGLLRVISDYDGAVTIVESEKDKLIARKYIEACLAVAQHGTHLVINGADHMLKGEEHAVYRGMILEWAKSL